MLSTKDLALLGQKGISEKQIEEQLDCFRKGFPFLEIMASASVEKGISVIDKEAQVGYMEAWDAYLNQNKRILKFVPASGAASRMFKDLYEFLDSDSNEPFSPFMEKFFAGLTSFAFYNALDAVCLKNEKRTIPQLLSDKEYKA
ncbi:MAG TPA: DUF4301 domain-containing protein, partial [Porphyromonadaceae bacterium]|nr:DUF4301 domain-containing protein [Porphyromonadaceae bacterium]